MSLLVFALVYSLIKELDVKMNEQQVYDCNDVNHVVNIKNLLEYSPGYASSTATNEFAYIDTNRHAAERTPEANYKTGFAARKVLLRISLIVDTEISLIEQIIIFLNYSMMNCCPTPNLRTQKCNYQFLVCFSILKDKTGYV